MSKKHLRKMSGTYFYLVLKRKRLCSGVRDYDIGFFDGAISAIAFAAKFRFKGQLMRDIEHIVNMNKPADEE